MNLKHDVGDEIYIKGTIDSVYISNDSEYGKDPRYIVRVKGYGRLQTYSLEVSETCFCSEKIVEHKPECEDCDCRKFTEQFIDSVVDVMIENGISSIEELDRRLKGEES